MLGDAHFLSLTDANPQWPCFFSNPFWVRAAYALPDVLPVLEKALAESRNGAWLVLALGYEAAAAFDPTLTVHTPPQTPLIFAAAYNQAPTSQRPRSTAGSAPMGTPWRPLVSRQAYGRAMGVLREYIRQGEVYQVNYTIPLVSRFTGDPAVWFAALAREQAAGYCCHLDMGRHQALSFSPELFFARRGETVLTRPMKGTLPRGRTPEEDMKQAAALAASSKNQAENRMITDLLRNDLGRIARPGSVAVTGLFAVERLGAVWQMTSTVSAQVPREKGLETLLTALFPCGSITGAPKRSAMRIIHELEPDARGLYTGAIGHVAPDGDCTFSVAIRTVSLDTQTGQCRFGVGGGVTHYSDTADEYAECRAKARFLHEKTEPFELLETMRLAGGRYAFLPEHLARLARSAAYYGFPYLPTSVQKALEAVRGVHARGTRRVRLLLARDGAVRVETYPLSPRPKTPLRLGWADQPVDAADPALFHKTTRRALYDQTLTAHPDCDDVLLYNAARQVTESCRANLVVALGGRLVTPQLGCGLLPGTYRQRLLTHGVLTEATLTPKNLAAASCLWLINSVRLWTPAVLTAPGPVAG